ncbi:MAG: hypothetical protein ACLPPF_09145 [Rhodomicrobium sp.]
MKLLLDTHVLLWAAGQPERLPVRSGTPSTIDWATRQPADPQVARYPCPVRLV